MTTLLDLCELIVDCEHKTAPLAETGYPSIRTPNVGKGRLLLSGVNRVTEETYLAWSRRATPQPDDLIIAREAPLGNVAIIKTGQKVCLGQRTVLVRPNRHKVDPAYLCYFLLGDYAQGRFHGSSIGATVPHLNMKDIRGLVIPALPLLPTQRCIASILSAYDDLIENNSRRIAILEEMARRIYEEWFVHFRFPDATDHIKDWAVVQLRDICVIQTGPFGSQLHQSDYSDEGVPVIMPKDMVTPRLDSSTMSRIPEELASRLGRHRMKVGDIAYGRRGDIGRRTFIGPNQQGWLCGTGCILLRPDPIAVAPRFLFDALNSPMTLSTIKGRAKGATMPNLSASLMESVPIQLPPRELQDRYVKIVEPMEALAESLSQSNQNLRNTRDLLLPKLISGELDVSEIAA